MTPKLYERMYILTLCRVILNTVEYEDIELYEKECISVNLSRCVQPIFEISSVQLNKAMNHL